MNRIYRPSSKTGQWASLYKIMQINSGPSMQILNTKHFITNACMHGYIAVS